MFQENKDKRSPLQIIGIVIIFILAVLIILTFVLYGMFNDSNSAPKLFGYRVSVVPNDRMEPKVPEGAAVFVTEGAEPEENNVVLCYIGEQLCIIRFVGTEINPQTGDISYLVKYDSDGPDMIWGIARNDIVGVADTYDSFFGWVIRFASSKAGMMTIVIIPCIFVILYEVAMLALQRGSSKKRRSSSSSKYRDRPRPVAEAVEPAIRRVGGGPDDEDVSPQRENIQIPIDAAKEERFVEKQLRRANDSLSTTIHETGTAANSEEINLESISVKSDASSKRPEMTFGFDEPRPARPKPESITPSTIELPDTSSAQVDEAKPQQTPAKPAVSEKASGIIGDLSASRIDELIRLLEEEKKRLGEDN